MGEPDLVELREMLRTFSTRFDAGRPHLAAALDAVKTGRAATLIVSKLDRLSRSVHDASGLQHMPGGPAGRPSSLAVQPRPARRCCPKASLWVAETIAVESQVHSLHGRVGCSGAVVCIPGGLDAPRGTAGERVGVGRRAGCAVRTAERFVACSCWCDPGGRWGPRARLGIAAGCGRLERARERTESDRHLRAPVVAPIADADPTAIGVATDAATALTCGEVPVAVCDCVQVDDATLDNAVRAQLRSVEDVQHVSVAASGLVGGA